MVQTTKLGGTAKDVVVGRVGTGLMMLTGVSPNVPDEQAFAAIKAAVDAVPAGAKMLLNSSQFYAQDFGTGNLELLARFFDKHPGYADKVFLSVKGGTKPNSIVPDHTPAGLRTSIELCVKALRGTKKIDLFETARVVRTVPLAEQVDVLKGFVAEGLFDHVGLSECSAQSLREINALVPVAAVEIEVSPWLYEEETKKVIAACEELGVAVVAYSPLGRGFLTGQQQLDKGDPRNRLSRFQGEARDNNLKLVDALTKVATKKGISTAQLCLAWVQSLGEHVVPIPGSSKASRVLDNIKTSEITFTADELAEIARVLEENPVAGGRYFDAPNSVLNLWG